MILFCSILRNRRLPPTQICKIKFNFLDSEIKSAHSISICFCYPSPLLLLMYQRFGQVHVGPVRKIGMILFCSILRNRRLPPTQICKIKFNFLDSEIKSAHSISICFCYPSPLLLLMYQCLEAFVTKFLLTKCS